MWKLPKIKRIPLPRRGARGGKIRKEITPGARQVPPGTLVFDGENKDLWWVKVILNVGRPVVAVIVLVMCAPGEHFLAMKAGWPWALAWGMPATLTAYAGIAAVVATKRPKKSPGKKTAVMGAIISVTLAMGAQPIAHLYQLKLISGYDVPLTIIVSCIPALVFGHLLHMAAAPVDPSPRVPVPEDRTYEGMSEDTQDTIRRTFDVPEDMTGGQEGFAPTARLSDEPGPDAMRHVPEDSDTDSQEDTAEDMTGDPLGDNSSLDYLRRPPVLSLVRSEDMARDNHISRDNTMTEDELSRLLSSVPEPVTRDNGDVPPVSVLPVVRSSVPPDVPARRPAAKRSGRSGKPSLPSRVRSLLADDPFLTDAQLREAMAGEVPNSVNKAIKRVREEIENGS